MLYLTRGRHQAVMLGSAKLTLQRIYPQIKFWYEKPQHDRRALEFTPEELANSHTFDLDGVTVRLGYVTTHGKLVIGFEAAPDLLILREELTPKA